MPAHRLVLGRINTDCVVMVNAEVAAAMGARLDRVMRNELAAALAQAVAPLLDGYTGVLRLKYLRIHVDLGEQLEQPNLAQILAEQIAAALKEQLQKALATLKYWPDHDSYLADYILMRLGTATHPDWAFPDLVNFGHLPAERAAAELIRTRPTVLGALAIAAVTYGDAAAPLVSWPIEAKTALVRALVTAPLNADEANAVLPCLRQLLTMPLAAPTGVAPAHLLSEALTVALRLLAHELPNKNSVSRAAVFASIAALAVRMDEHATPAVNQLAGADMAAASAEDQAVTTRVLAFVEADPQRRAVLERLIGVPNKLLDKAEQSIKTEPQHVESATVQDSLRSPRLGLALLLPSVMFLDAAAHLTQTQLAQIVWQTLQPADWPAAAQDPVLQLLLPIKPLEVDLHAAQPQPPERLLGLLAEPARKVYEDSASELRWSALLLADFASRLRGLHGSSHAYLRSQFLERAGEVRRKEDQIRVLLDPIPLGIILHMAGFAGLQGRLPQPGQPQLILRIGERP